MKTVYLLAPLGAIALLAGCSTYVERVPTAVVSTPAVVAAAPVAPAYVGTLADSDGDGVADIYDRFPFDARYR